MKLSLILVAALVTLFLALGSPFPAQQPETARNWSGPEPVLPMAFDHVDHGGLNCIGCHHNFADETGDSSCMHCHMTDGALKERLRDQFHGLCMGCHVETQVEGKEHGPIRRCMECHASLWPL